MPQLGETGDIAEVKDSLANVDEFVSPTGELASNYGFVLDWSHPVVTGSGAATVPSSASYVEIGAITGAVQLTLPAASAVSNSRILIVNDTNGTVSSSATVSLQTPSSASGKIGNVAAGVASTSAASYAFMNAAYSSVRLISNGTNWNPF